MFRRLLNLLCILVLAKPFCHLFIFIVQRILNMKTQRQRSDLLQSYRLLSFDAACMV
jgi:hypothetical protein